MIRVLRPKTEPPALRKQRLAGLRRAFAALNQYGAASSELKDELTRYDGGKAALFRAQHRKCAYCERRQGLEANPLEHVRPKKEAWRHLPGQSPAIIAEGYWWLTWTWRNQLFACHSCNSGIKKNYFPLAPGSGALLGPVPPYQNKRLLPAHLDFSSEEPLLVDPSTEDPLDHIQWRPVDPQLPTRRWIWSPVGLTDKGKATIKILRLEELADDVGNHVRDNVLPRARSVCAAIDAGHHRRARRLWRELAGDVARSDSALAGPTWNALDFLVDSARRTDAKLPPLPRP